MCIRDRAGIQAAGRGKQVLILEKMERPGRKLLITGKGRCNVTNCCTVEDFMLNVLSNKRFLYSSLNALNPYEVMGFFEDCGVALKVERGERVFPVSDRSADIVDALVNKAQQSGCRITSCLLYTSIFHAASFCTAWIVSVGKKQALETPTRTLSCCIRSSPYLHKFILYTFSMPSAF